MARRPIPPKVAPFPPYLVRECQDELGDYRPITDMEHLVSDLTRAQAALLDAERTEEAAFFTQANTSLDRARSDASLALVTTPVLGKWLPYADVLAVRDRLRRLSDTLDGLPSASFDVSPDPARVQELANAAVDIRQTVKYLTSRAIATCLANSMEGS